MTYQKLRRDVISAASGQAEQLTRGVVTGGNKVTIKTHLVATCYSLIIRWLSLSVILVALDLRKKLLQKSFTTRKQVRNSIKRID